MESEADYCPVPRGERPQDCPIPGDRRINDRWREEITRRVTDMEDRIEENTNLTKTIAGNTAEIVEFFQAGKGFFTIVRVVGTIAKWITAVAAAGLIMWAAARFGLQNLLQNGRHGGGGD